MGSRLSLQRMVVSPAPARMAALDGPARFVALRGNFHDAKELLAGIGVTKVDGILADLGVSSHQLDVRERGFSYHDDAPLDMRMDQSQPWSAYDVVNTWSEDDLNRVIRDFGEENWARQIARVICDRRKTAPIERTSQLVGIIDAAIPKKSRMQDSGHSARRTFQALRIAVNDELEPLHKAIEDMADLLNPDGQLAVITFHSLEDRIVKQTFAKLSSGCECPRDFPVCVCGKKPKVKIISRKPIVSSAEELEANPRARSAKLRVCEKI